MVGTTQGGCSGVAQSKSRHQSDREFVVRVEKGCSQQIHTQNFGKTWTVWPKRMEWNCIVQADWKLFTQTPCCDCSQRCSCYIRGLQLQSSRAGVLRLVDVSLVQHTWINGWVTLSVCSQTLQKPADNLIIWQRCFEAEALAHKALSWRSL